MRYLKEYSNFGDNYNWLEDIFSDLKDDGFTTHINERKYSKVTWPESNRLSSAEVANSRSFSYTVDVIEVIIRRIKNTQRFNLDEVVKKLEFATSYAKEELGLETYCFYTSTVPNYTYYRSLTDVPKGINLDSITIAFKKI